MREIGLGAGSDRTFAFASTLSSFAATSAENLEFLRRSLVELDPAARRTSIEVFEALEENRLVPVRQAVAGLDKIQFTYLRSLADLVVATAAAAEAHGDAEDLAEMDDAAYAAAVEAARLAASARRDEIVALPGSARLWARSADES